MVDLTDTFGAGNEPTAQEFYNKYKGYFLALTKGEKVIAGKGKIAGGSSDIYYGYNQLINPITSTTTNAGITGTFNETNLSRSYSGTATSSAWCQLGFYRHVINKHKYLFLVNVDLTGTSMYYAPLGGGSCKDSCIYQADRTTDESDYLVVPKDAIADISNLISQAIDLTEWFGAGKEPTTVAEFKEKFAKEYYGLCKIPIKLTRYQIEALPSYGYNQLVKNGNFVDKTNWASSGGSTVWSVSNNILTFKAVQRYGGIRQDISIIGGHTYLFMGDVKKGSSSHSVHFTFSNFSPNDFYALDNTDWQSLSGIMAATSEVSSCILYIRDYAESGWTDNYIKNVMLIDLTDWYGAGNEPTTIEEFKQTFPNKYYPYSKKRLLNKYMINKLVN